MCPQPLTETSADDLQGTSDLTQKTQPLAPEDNREAGLVQGKAVVTQVKMLNATGMVPTGNVRGAQRNQGSAARDPDERVCLLAGSGPLSLGSHTGQQREDC